jgi:hypothetical protein
LKDMANIREPLLSRREKQHAKGAGRHGPKGKQSGRWAWRSLRADVALPAVRRSLRPSGMVRMRNVVSPSVPTGMWKAAREGVPVDVWVWDVGKSECRSVMDRIGVRALPYPKGG